MKITVHTNNAQTLSKAIKEKTKSQLETWEHTTDSTDGYNLYFHSTKSKQWEDELYIQPILYDDNKNLEFHVTKIDGKPLKFKPEYGYLMGRFLEILIVHFASYYNNITIE
ncbi:hypothetical protein ACPDHQ_16870 [Myroides odoratimimus]|uniref:hypothetical protein n=1 Tax=Myroides odoratimimus TaxID=76832 RepID=UPI0025755E6A|nr:hypothetical protein [Myroides odoratimimus]MDM1499501.1 hypothetical protein [Myroides odoratimimus]MDM1530200.1 hypothetical protein [Myroides odoratimimus]MEC4077932.1 hypothetical protein [Myroides odoratimimus]